MVNPGSCREDRTSHCQIASFAHGFLLSNTQPVDILGHNASLLISRHTGYRSILRQHTAGNQVNLLRSYPNHEYNLDKTHQLQA